MFCALNGRRRHSMHLDAGDGPFPRRHRASGQLGRLPRITASASLLSTLLCLFFRQDYAEVLSQPESYPSQHQAVMQGMTHLLGSSGGEGGGGLPGTSNSTHSTFSLYTSLSTFEVSVFSSAVPVCHFPCIPPSTLHLARRYPERDDLEGYRGRSDSGRASTGTERPSTSRHHLSRV
jgi:hypothetical protein